MMDEKEAKTQRESNDILTDLPQVLQILVVNYLNEPHRLHMWMSSAKHGDDWRWTERHIPAFDTLDFRQFFCQDRAEIIQCVECGYPAAIEALLNNDYENLYDKFYVLDTAPEFYLRVAYVMLQSLPEPFQVYGKIDWRTPVDQAFRGLAHNSTGLWDTKTHNKPRVNLKMLECLLSSCKRHGITFERIGQSELVIKNIFGIGAINRMSVTWYRERLEMLNVPADWCPHNIYTYAEHFPTNADLAVAIKLRWQARVW